MKLHSLNRRKILSSATACAATFCVGALRLLVAGEPAPATRTINTSDYPSIQHAINANPGRSILLPDGEHRISSPILITNNGTVLHGFGKIVQTDPRAPIIRVENAAQVVLRDLTLTRPEGAQETTQEAVHAINCEFLRLDDLRVRDNHGSGTAIRLANCLFSRIAGCEVVNYKRVSVDDRTASELYGYAFHCFDGHGIIVAGGRGNAILNNRVIERRLLPTRENKERYQLGSLAEGRQPTRFGVLGREVERTRFARNWHQGSAILVTGPEETEFTRISGNYLENCAQGIDLHCDRFICTDNIVNHGMMGMKAMHGSRHGIIANNVFSHVDLWAIMLGPGSASHHAEEAKNGHPARTANHDGSIVITGNVISDYGYGHEFWNWGGSVAIRLDRGQLPSNPPISEVLIQGNVVTDTGKHGVLVDGKVTYPKPRYRYALQIESSDAGKSEPPAPTNIRVLDNLFDPGTEGVANVPLPYEK